MAKLIKAVFGAGQMSKTCPQWQYDYNTILQFVGLDLPATFEVDLANSKTGQSTTVLGDADGCCTIPAQYFIPGTSIFAWVYIVDSNSGYTRCQVEIPIHPRAQHTGDPPTPEQQSALDQAIAMLNAATANIPSEINAALEAAKESGEFDGADGSGVWYTTARVSGDDNPFVRRRDLIGREGATVQVHDLLFAPDVGCDGEPTTLYEITSVGTVCTLKRLCKMQGANGTDGASAYEIAVEHGYTGTEAEWLNSLHGADAVVDPTLSVAGEAADAAETGKVKHTADYALTFAETLNSGNGIPVDGVWERGGIGTYGNEENTRTWRARTKNKLSYPVDITLKAASGFRLCVASYRQDGTFIDITDGKTSWPVTAGAIFRLVSKKATEDTSVPADLDVFGAAITIQNNIGSGGGITVDDALSDSSTNPVQNKVIKAALDGKGTYSKPSGGIPKTDLAEDVQTSLDKANTALQDHQSLAAFRTAADQDAIDLQQNMAIAAKYAKPAGGIPASDLAAGVIPTVPSNVSSFENDAGYLTQHQDISGKLDKAQGVAHAGEFCVVGSDGNITTVSMTAWQGGSY